MSGADRPITYGQVAFVAQMRYQSDLYESTTERIYALLVDVADCYVSHLEAHPAAAEHPAPYKGYRTPMQAALVGLQQSLEAKRDGRVPQHRT